MPISDESVIWAYRMLLGREPENPNVIAAHAARYNSLDELQTTFMRMPGAQNLLRKVRKPAYSLPLFLLRRPDFPDVSWQFEEPSLSNPVTQLCTSEQMQSHEYRDLCATLGLDHTFQHRKHWEFAYILAVLRTKGMLQPGKRGLGFGTGHEKLPSVFANAGATIMATDAPAELGVSEQWAGSGQWTKSLEDLWRPELIEKADFLQRVQYRPVDMNLIPEDLESYDFCWSACALEHLGSIRKGLDFIRNSVKTLGPGGVAVHTTEFNLQSNMDTLNRSPTCIPRKQDIEQVIHELVADGHHVASLNLWPGTAPVDEHIDLPPFLSPPAFAHLKLSLTDIVTTSIGIIVTKRQN